jgi:hypothetical protein
MVIGIWASMTKKAALPAQAAPATRATAHGDAILLRPSDIDQIIKVAMTWVVHNPTDPRSFAVVDEIAAGAKAVAVHFAERAGAR